MIVENSSMQRTNKIDDEGSSCLKPLESIKRGFQHLLYLMAIKIGNRADMFKA